MEKREKGYFQQIAITKGGDGQTACGSFPGIYTRLDDPEVFDWVESVMNQPDEEPTRTGIKMPTSTEIKINEVTCLKITKNIFLDRVRLRFYIFIFLPRVLKHRGPRSVYVVAAVQTFSK